LGPWEYGNELLGLIKGGKFSGEVIISFLRRTLLFGVRYFIQLILDEPFNFIVRCVRALNYEGAVFSSFCIFSHVMLSNRYMPRSGRAKLM
jgi:hypothetical protein